MARYLPITNHVTLLAAVMSPYLTIGGPLALMLLLLARRWLSAIAAACLAVAGIVVQVPMHVGSAHIPPHSTPIRVMSANTYFGLADENALVAAANSDADILAVQELTPDAVERLAKAGLDKEFPYRKVYPHDIASGAGIWSRYPISMVTPIWGYRMIFVGARVDVPDIAVDPTIVIVHVAGPWPQPIADWKGDITLLSTTMEQAARGAGSGAVIVAGDFNSTIDMRPYRELLRNGYNDAAEQAGVGRTPTYPGNSWLPPHLGIDHIVVRNCVATAVKTVRLPGSDHLALVSTVEVPRHAASVG